MGYDDVIERMGKFGRYQRRIFLVMYLPFIVSSFHKMGGVFLSARADFRCLIPGENPDTAIYELPPNITNNLTSIWDPKTKKYPRCEINDPNQLIDSNQTSGRNDSSPIPTIKCDSFVYDTSTYTRTATTEWDIVCDNEWLKPLADSLFMLGDLPGAVILGALSDRFGRKRTLMWGSIVQLFLGLLLTVAPNFYAYILLRLLLGVCSGLFLTAYVTLVETVVPKNRIAAGISGNFMFATGYILTGILAYFIRQWRYLQLVFTVPSVILLSFLWTVPESPRWLLNRGYVDEAKEVLSNAFKENDVKISPETLESLLIENRKSSLIQEKTTLFDLLRYPNIRKKSLLLFFVWFVNGTIFYGLSWNSSNLGGDHYLNYILTGVVEYPAHLTLYIWLDKWGRKVFSCGAMLIAGMALVLTFLVPEGMTWPLIVLVMAGKFAITWSWTSAFIITAEQYPTSVRAVGLTACSAIAKCGGALAPYINYLFQISTYVPLVILGLSALVAGALSLMLPETLNAKLLDTIQDGEDLAKIQKKSKLDVEQSNDAVATKLLENKETEMRQIR